MQQMMNEKEYRIQLSEILLGLAGNFGDTFDAQTMNLWRRMFDFDGITLDQIQEAAIKIMRTRKISKMPTYAEFIEHIHGSSADRARQQADVVIEFLRRNGSRATPKFEDQVTELLMTSCWSYQRWASQVKDSDLHWFKKDFIEAYQSYAKGSESLPADRQIAASEKVLKLTKIVGGKTNKTDKGGNQ